MTRSGSNQTILYWITAFALCYCLRAWYRVEQKYVNKHFQIESKTPLTRIKLVSFKNIFYYYGKFFELLVLCTKIFLGKTNWEKCSILADKSQCWYLTPHMWKMCILLILVHFHNFKCTRFQLNPLQEKLFLFSHSKIYCSVSDIDAKIV